MIMEYVDEIHDIEQIGIVFVQHSYIMTMSVYV